MNLEEEKKRIKLMNEDMYCNEYDMECMEVPYEVLTYVGGLGFSDYDCDLNCKECPNMKLY